MEMIAIVFVMLCYQIGADEDNIRKGLRQTNTLIAMLDSFNGGKDKQIEALFGGSTPSRSLCAAARADIVYKRRNLHAWLDDCGRREIMINTGRFMSPSEIGAEIKSRR